MKNFMDRIVCIIEPDTIYSHDGESDEIIVSIRCRSFGKDLELNKRVPTDFMVSYFDMLFDEMKEMIKEKFLDGVKES